MNDESFGVNCRGCARLFIEFWENLFMQMNYSRKMEALGCEVEKFRGKLIARVVLLPAFLTQADLKSARRHLIKNVTDIEGTKQTFSSSFLKNSFSKAGHNFVPSW